MPIDATQPYDDSNIFARILRGEIPSKTVYEDEHVLAFHDINPLAPDPHPGDSQGALRLLGRFLRASARTRRSPASSAPSARIARDAGLVEPGYRLLAKSAPNSGQEVPHLHVHIFGGRPLGPMLAR